MYRLLAEGVVDTVALLCRTQCPRIPPGRPGLPHFNDLAHTAFAFLPKEVHPGTSKLSAVRNPSPFTKPPLKPHHRGKADK
jgi:hypothetical protein